MEATKQRSYFRNWHKSFGRSTKTGISETFPVRVTGHISHVSIQFADEWGKRIIFELNKEDSALFIDQVSRLKPNINR